MLDRRADGTQRIVLVDERDPERGHHRIADELLDRAAVAFEHLARGLVVTRPASRSASGSSCSPSGVDPDVAEDERDGLSDHVPSLGRWPKSA